MAHVSRSDPLEIQVLDALASGTATAADVALRTAQAELVVGAILEQAVAEQSVTRIDFRKSAAYSLTPKGLHTIGVYQGVPGAVEDAGHLEDAVRDVATDHLDDAVRDAVVEPPPAPPSEIGPMAGGQAGHRLEGSPAFRTVRWRHVVYAAVYVLLGLAFMILQPVVGLVIVLAGLVLGGYALRPLWRAGTTRVTDR